ncbi:MAG: DUF4199 domain-containing protein [Muribaculaceae bacterium]|nr:DUF4199 domain-containing protein [Muribaculaceae bacterium]
MESNKNVFVKSAELGVPFGALLLAASMSQLYFDKIQPLAYVTLLVAIVAPIVIYRFQRKRFIESDGFAIYSELWTLGIFTTIGGALICGLITYGVITLFRPDFLYEQAQLFIDLYKEQPVKQMQEVVDVMEKMVKNNLLPTPIDYCMQMFWLTTSLGCIGSAVTAFFAGKTNLKKK